MGLRDWVSEKVRDVPIPIFPHVLASMGLRDWVSEKVVTVDPRSGSMGMLQWGSETGSRRRRQRGS